MAERNYDELARRIEQELLDGSFKLDRIGNERQVEGDAARVARRFLIKRLGITENYAPTIVEIRSYSLIYNRALELVKQGEIKCK